MIRTLLVMVCGAVLAFAADPWKEKKSSEWSDKDAQRVLTNSPWAKQVTAEMDLSRMGAGGPRSGGGGRRGGGGGMGGMGGGGGMGGMGGGGMSGPGGGGMGGPGGMGGGGGMGGPGGGGMGPGGDMGAGAGRPAGMEPPKVTVRWESAEPVHDAAVKTEDPNASRFAEWSKEYYVVSVSGMRMMGGRGGMGNPDGAGGDGRPQPDPSRMEQMQQRMKEATLLKRKGRDPIAPAQIQMLRTPQGMVTVFLFPREEALSADDKELSFETQFGPMAIKSKFSPKEMQYGGKLSL